MALAEWITAGEPTMDLSSVDIRRFVPHHNNKRYLQECVKETLSWHYLLRFPFSERNRARGLRCSALFSELDAAGATWGDKMGWEVAKWFSLPGEGNVELLGNYRHWSYRMKRFLSSFAHSLSGIQLENRSFSSCLLPHFQNKSSYETIHIKMCFLYSFIFTQLKLVFISNALPEELS